MIERSNLHHYIAGSLAWQMRCMKTPLRHTIHLIDVAQAEDLRAFQNGLRQLLSAFEKLEASLPKYIEQTKEVEV